MAIPFDQIYRNLGALSPGERDRILGILNKIDRPINMDFSSLYCKKGFSLDVNHESQKTGGVGPGNSL
jgi:hypothetical protein